MKRVLVTRPEPDNSRTAQALRALGHAPLQAPLFGFQANSSADLTGAFDAVIATSANALRALQGHGALSSLRALPLFAVGAATQAMARDIGFANTIAGEGNAKDLQQLILSHLPANSGARLLYLAGADISHDLAGALEACGVNVQMRVVYAMAPIDPWPDAEQAAQMRAGFDAVLHYSARSAEFFADFANVGGLSAAAHEAQHLCMSEQVAEPLRRLAFKNIYVAAKPREAALFALLEP